MSGLPLGGTILEILCSNMLNVTSYNIRERVNENECSGLSLEKVRELAGNKSA